MNLDFSALHVLYDPLAIIAYLTVIVIFVVVKNKARILGEE